MPRAGGYRLGDTSYRRRRPGTRIDPYTGQRVPVTRIDQLPPGSVDPALTYAMDAANRGLGYNIADYNLNWAGFQGGPNGVVRPDDLDALNPDGTFKYGRGVRDYFQSLDRTNHQFDEQRDDTSRGYQQLGNRQLQSVNQSGLAQGGALAQALAKRTANEGRDQERIQYARSGTLSDLLTNATRAAGDAYTGLTRAEGENAPYQATLTTQAIQGAQGALADDPGYEVINGVLYQRTPGGGVKPVASGGSSPAPAPTAPAVAPRPVQHNGTGGFRAPGPIGNLVRVPDRPRRRRRQNTGGFRY